MISLDLRQGDRLSEADREIDRAGHHWDSPWEADLSLHSGRLAMVHLQVASLDLAVDAHLATAASDNDLLGRSPDTVLGVSLF